MCKLSYSNKNWLVVVNDSKNWTIIDKCIFVIILYWTRWDICDTDLEIIHSR